MQSLKIHRGLVAPMDRANVDTDAIIPKQFLKSIKRTGFGPNLFDEWRYMDRGEPGMDNARRPLNPNFVLNQPRYKSASVLLARKNFGCGSSREHAPWALLGAGYRVVLARSFGDIFTQNSLKNGLLPVALDDAPHAALVAWTGDVTVDLAAQTVVFGRESAPFAVDPFSKDCLARGVDELGAILARLPEIEAFEARRTT